MPDGLFLTVEGIDGAGKSTQAAMLAQHLRTKGREVVLTREPGGSPGGEAIRRLLVEADGGDWSATTELLLFTAARRDHVEKIIRPALERGQVVISDRYIDSTRAYQGKGDLAAEIEELHARLIGLDPVRTLIYDLSPEDARARADRRAAGAASREDRFERRGVAFQGGLRSAFHEIAAAEPARVRLIDASGTAGQVFARTCAALEDLIGG
ncbi:MAG: dTMP kinase [Pseudomonadota bacterium]